MLSDSWQLRSREDHRFWQLTSGVWVASLTGVLYAFGVISDEIKEQFHFTQEDLTTISTIGFVSCVFGFSGGFTWDKWGATPVLIASACMISASFLILGLTFDGILPVSIPLLSFSQAIAALGIVWGDVGSLMTNMLNFPLNQGAMVLIQKTWMGLGGTVFAVIYIGWFNHRPDAYCYFVAVFILVGYLPAILYLNVPKMDMIEKRRALGHSWAGVGVASEEEIKEAEEQREFLLSVPADPRRLNIAYFILAFMLFFLVTATSLNAVYEVTPAVSAMLATIAVSVVVLGYGSLGFLPFTGAHHRFSQIRQPPLVMEQQHGRSPNVSSVAGGGSVFTTLVGSLPSVPYSPSTMTAATNRTRQPAEFSNSNSEGGGTTSHHHHHHTCSTNAGGSATPTVVVSSSDGDREMMSPGNNNSTGTTAGSNGGSGGGRKYETSFWESLHHLDIWLLWWASFCMWGSGKTLALNCAQIYRAVNNDVFVSSTNAFYVAMVGVGGALGRIIVGLVDQKLINPPVSKLGKKARSAMVGSGGEGKWSTTHMYPPCAVLLIVGCLLFLTMGPSALALPFVITAAGYGCSWAATVLLVPQMFAKDIGKHYNFLFSSMISIIFLNRGLFGTSFTAEALRQSGGKEDTRCSGQVCIQTPMIVMALLNCSALATCILVHKRWRKFQTADHGGTTLDRPGIL